MLANVDRQSDTLRDSIERTAFVREKKRSEVMLSVLKSGVLRTLRDAEKKNKPNFEALRKIVEKIMDGSVNVDRAFASTLIVQLRGFFINDPDVSCMIMFFLAATTKRSEHLSDAQEAIDAWIEDLVNPVERVWAGQIASLAAFGAGDAAEAIDRAEDAVNMYEAVNLDTLDLDVKQRMLRIGNSLLTSLAYYHADIVGSHDGKQRGSEAAAKSFLSKSHAFRGLIGLPIMGLDSREDEIVSALKCGSSGHRVFDTLDNEAFVRIQTANSIDELRFAAARLALVHKEKPLEEDSKGLLYDFHDYCARARLSELEAG